MTKVIETRKLSSLFWKNLEAQQQHCFRCYCFVFSVSSKQCKTAKTVSFQNASKCFQMLPKASDEYCLTVLSDCYAKT